MGQAKQRQAEISKIKVESSTVNAVTLRFIAKRHLVGHTKPEFVVAEVSFTPNEVKEIRRADRSELLATCCLSCWDQNAPIYEIAAYLLLSNSYTFYNSFNYYGMELNFYKNDPERPSHYSCRLIIGMSKSIFHDEQLSLLASTKNDADFNLKLLSTRLV